MTMRAIVGLIVLLVLACGPSDHNRDGGVRAGIDGGVEIGSAPDAGGSVDAGTLPDAGSPADSGVSSDGGLFDAGPSDGGGSRDAGPQQCIVPEGAVIDADGGSCFLGSVAQWSEGLHRDCPAGEFGLICMSSRPCPFFDAGPSDAGPSNCTNGPSPPSSLGCVFQALPEWPPSPYCCPCAAPDAG